MGDSMKRILFASFGLCLSLGFWAGATVTRLRIVRSYPIADLACPELGDALRRTDTIVLHMQAGAGVRVGFRGLLAPGAT